MGSTYIEIGPSVLATILNEVEVTNDVGNPVPVSAIDLDIRDLEFATDKADVSGSTVALDAPTLAALENITVSATDFDIRDLEFASDTVDVTGSTVALDASTLAALENITVSATDLDIRNLEFATDKVDASGSTVTAITSTVSAATLSNVAGSATSVQLLASTPTRLMATFFNDSSSTAYLKLGTTASTSSYTVLMRPFDYYELSSPVYTGRIDAIWDSAAGNMRITEM